MDEPFTGLDPVNVVLMREAFFELREQGIDLCNGAPPWLDGSRRP